MKLVNMCHGSNARKLATVYASREIWTRRVFSCREELGLTSVCDYYAEPHDLIRSASLPCRLDRALYRSKKKIDHKNCEDDGNRLVLPFRTSYGVSQIVTFIGRERTHDRGLLSIEKRKQAMTMEARKY